MPEPVIIEGAERVRVAWAASHELGEGALWSRGRLLHVDIYGPSGSGQAGPAVYSLDPATGAARAYPVPSYCGTVVPCAGGGARAAVALRDGVYALDLASGALARLFPGLAPGADCRFNDGKASPEGRLWVGSMGAPGHVEVSEDRARARARALSLSHTNTHTLTLSRSAAPSRAGRQGLAVCVRGRRRHLPRGGARRAHLQRAGLGARRPHHVLHRHARGRRLRL